VLVVGGGGSEALYGAAVAGALGSSRVLYLDPDEGRREVAFRLGAEADAGPCRAELGEFEVIFDAAGDSERLIDAITLLAPEGHVESVGGHFGAIPLPGIRAYQQGIHFHTGIASANHADVHASLDLILSGAVDPTVVYTETLPIHDAAEALADPSLKPVFLRDPLTPQT
jgi:alcohol dehydrogenase